MRWGLQPPTTEDLDDLRRHVAELRQSMTTILNGLRDVSDRLRTLEASAIRLKAKKRSR